MPNTAIQDIQRRLTQLVAEREKLDEEFHQLSSQVLGLSPMKVRRVLRWFNRSTEELAGSAPIHGPSLMELQRMFRVEPDDPMYDCYPLESAQASQLQAYVDAPIRLNDYDYFVEADAVCEPPLP